MSIWTQIKRAYTSVRLPEWLLKILGVLGKEKPAQKRRKRRERAEDRIGEFHLKGAILDQLDRYFFYMQRIKKLDRDAYSLFSKFGAHVVPYLYPSLDALTLPSWWNKNRPSFGAVAFAVGADFESREDDNKTYPRFLYFRKYDGTGSFAGRIAPFSGDVYAVTLYWDYGTGSPKKNSMPADYAVGLEPGGKVRVLPVLHDTVERPKRSKRNRHGGAAVIPIRRWSIHPMWKKFAEDNGRPVEEYLVAVFVWIATMHQSAASAMTRVAASRDGIKAVFAVGIERTPTFFKDRELSADGTKKRIFHIVRAHQRASGQLVRTHFRGERSFSWNGYEITITVPGWHHFDVFGFNVASHNVEDDAVVEDGLDAGQLAQFINEHIEKGSGGEYPRRKQA